MSLSIILCNCHLGFYAGIPDFSVTPVSTWQPSLDCCCTEAILSVHSLITVIFLIQGEIYYRLIDRATRA